MAILPLEIIGPHWNRLDKKGLVMNRTGNLLKVLISYTRENYKSYRENQIITVGRERITYRSNNYEGER